MACVVQVPIFGFDESTLPAWDGGARSGISFAGDGYFRFSVDTSVAGACVGINTNDTSYHYSDIQFGFRFARDGFRVIESGTFRAAQGTYVAGSLFYVIRVGGDVLYIYAPPGSTTTYDARYPGLPLPADILYISTSQSFGAMFLDASLFEVNDYVYNEEGGTVYLPSSVGPANVPGQEALVAGSLPFVGAAYGSDTLGSFDAVVSGGLTFAGTASGSTTQGVLAGLLPFTAWAGDNLRGWARGKLPFSGGLNNGAAGTDGFQDGIGAKVRGSLGFTFEGQGYAANPIGVASGQLPFTIVTSGSDVARNAGDPDFADVALLLHFEGTDGSTTFTDSSGNNVTVTASGGAEIDTDAPLIGSGSLLIPNTGFDAITFPGLFNPSASDWTIEFRYEHTGAADAFARIFQTVVGDVNSAVSLVYNDASNLGFYADNSAAPGFTYSSPNIPLPVGEQHYAIVYEGTTLTLYIGGVVAASTTIAGLTDNSANDWAFGGNTSGIERSVTGVFDEIRITENVARYTAPFTPPTTQFPDAQEPSTPPEALDAFVANGELPFTLASFSYMLSGNYLAITLPELGRIDVLNTYVEELSDTLNAISSVADGSMQIENISETFSGASVVEAFYALQFTDSIVATDQVRQFTQQAVQILDAFAIRDTREIALVLTISEALLVEGPITVQQTVQLIDSLVATGAVQSQYSAVATVMSAIAMTDSRRAAFGYSVTDSADFSEELRIATVLAAAISESMAMADSTENLLTIVALIDESMALSESFELTAQYFAELISTGRLFSLIKSPAELAQGWVMNTEGRMPVSEYDNYAFNSLAYAPHEMLGCTDEGVYVLDGEDDAGVPISAEITSLLLDFATSRQKRMSAAWIGYNSNGELLLRVRAVDHDQFVEYAFVGRNIGEKIPPADNRFKIGKGMYSRYWQFELVNIDGADFELDQIELYPIRLDRRI